MHKFMIGLALALIALPAAAQTARDFDMCETKDDPDANIIGCTAIIAAGNAAPSDLAVLYDERGFAYFTKGLYEQAVADFTKAISYEPPDAADYAARGYAYEKGGHRDQAITDYQTTLKLASPDSQEALAAKTRLDSLGATP
jgi:tetratricopeptide (TPR) repeat protein